MPPITGILETSLYVSDLAAAIAFYECVFGFPSLYADHRMCAMNAGPAQVLLLFLKGASAQASETPGGVIPPSDGSGQLHLAFGIAKSALTDWESRLSECGIAVESRVDWPAGGRSIYFRDPDGHLLELATPGLWANY